MGTDDELARARRRYPIGERLRGRVCPLPWEPGRTGLFVDLGGEPGGFVDVLHLPEDGESWPAAGRYGFFEVLHHRWGQVRLFPLDAGMRSARYRVSAWSGVQWAAVTRRHPVGSTVIGTVIDVYAGDRTFGVRFEDFETVVEYDEEPPAVGDTGRYLVTRQLEWTRRILVRPDQP